MNFLMRRQDMRKKFERVSDSHGDMRLRSRAVTHTELTSPRKGQTAPSSEPDEKLLAKNQETREIRSSRSNVKLGSQDVVAGSPRAGPSSKDNHIAKLKSTPKSVSKSSKVVEVDESSPSNVPTPQKSTNILKETPKSAKKSGVDIKTPKSIAINATDDATPKPRTTRANRNLDDISSSTPKASGKTGATESTAKSKSSTDEGLRTPRKVRSNQPVQMPVPKESHSPSDDDFIDLKTRASSKTKKLVSKTKTPQKNGKAVVQLPGSNGEASYEEKDTTETKVNRSVSKPKNGTALEVPSVSSKRKNGVALETPSSGKNREVKKKRKDEEIANGVEKQSDESDCDSESSSSKFHLWPPVNA